MDDDKKEYFTNLRSIYNGALVNGPFSVILGSNKGLLAINDIYGYLLQPELRFYAPFYRNAHKYKRHSRL